MLQRENLQDLYPLSPMQEGMLFHAVQDRHSTAYVEQLGFRMNPAPSLAAFRATWELLVQRHAILRTVFVSGSGTRPMQAVLRSAPPLIRRQDLSTLAPAEQDRHIHEWKEADRLLGFDLMAAPPVRLVLFDLGRDQAEVVFTHHHILLDGWCLGILAAEFVHALDAIEAGRAPTLPKAAPYANYIRWLGAQDTVAAAAFWQDDLAGSDEVASLLHANKGTDQAGHTLTHTIVLDEAVGARLHALGVAAGATAATVLHALWGVVLGRLLDRSDVVFGSVIANRPEDLPGVDRMLGLLINTVPVRVRWDGGMDFAGLLGALQANLLARRQHEFLPLTEIQATAGRTLFDHVLLVQNYPLEQAMEAGSARIQHVTLFEHTHYGLAVAALPGAAPRFQLSYDSAALTAAEIAAIAEQLRAVAAMVAAEPNRALDGLPLLIGPPPADQATQNPEPETLTALIAASCRRHPDRIAVRCDGRTVSYAALDKAADSLAARLRAAVARPSNARIVLMAQRSELLPVAMLGIARAGAACVPIDPNYPPERIATLCRDSGCSLVLTAPAPGGALPEKALNAVPDGILVVEFPALPDKSDPVPDMPAPAPGDLLYVAYTSGSTGRPKGVMVEHRSVAAFARALPEAFGFAPGRSIFALTTITFDISVLELLCSLVHGMTVAVATDEAAADTERAMAELTASGADVIQVPPTRLQSLLDVQDGALPDGVRTLLVGGEKLPPSLAARLCGMASLATYNVYGPTETTIWSTAKRLDGGAVTIGRPLPGETAAVLSRNGRPCPPGIVGEICIGGVGLSRGYLGQAELTIASRVIDPGRPGATLYRTGDLGRLRADGELEILGRQDDQVKLRGFRIELGEVAAALAACAGIRQAVVQVRGAGTDASLVAYVVGDGLDADGLRVALSRRLPAWMVPSHILPMPSLPLLPSGKVDRKCLPDPLATQCNMLSGLPPRDTLERRLSDAFGKVLGVSPPGIESDFFSLGGHSLRAVQLLGRLRRDFSRHLQLRDLFASPSVAQLAALLRDTVPAAGQPIPHLPEAATYALSPAQRRMWLLERMLPGGSAYLLPSAFRITGALNVPHLQAALDALVARHDVLRTTFPERNGEPCQVVLLSAPVEIERLHGHPMEAAQRFLGTPFKLGTGTGFRVGLLEEAPDRHVLLLALHHIVADGVSLDLLRRDLGRLYGAPGRVLPPACCSFRDVAAWQNGLLAAPEAERDRAYWHDRLSGVLPPTELLTDRLRPAVADPAGAALPVALDLAESNALRRLARVQGTTPFAVAAALVAALLHRHGNADVRLGFPVAGRMHPDQAEVVGPFINTLVLRLRPDPKEGFAALLTAARDALNAALDHQTYPFDRLVDELQVARDPARTPVFDVMVTYADWAEAAPRLGPLRVEAVELATTAARFDLTFAFGEGPDGGLALAIEYRTALFTPGRIGQLAAQLRTLLAGACTDPGQSIATLPILPAAERAAILAAASGPRTASTTAQVAWASLPDLLDAQVLRTPHAVALRFQDEEWSYARLHREANRLARFLLTDGVGRGDLAAILLDRSPTMVVALLAVLKAGAAYLPIDPDYPTARIGLMLEDSQARCLLSTGARLAGLATHPTVTIMLDDAEVRAALARQDDAPPDTALFETLGRPVPSAMDLAYVIYTSGSTGRPKGAGVYAQGVVNLLLWYIRDLGLTESDRGLLISAFGFDLTQKNMLAPLLVGASLRLPATLGYDPRALTEEAGADGVTFLNCTPSAFYPLLEQQAACNFAGLRTLRWAVLGGEPIQPARLRAFLASVPGVRVMNSYGPTECADVALAWALQGPDEDPVPLGRPIGNVQAVLLDAHRQPVPRGVAGDLWIGGAGVGSGYGGADQARIEKANAEAFHTVDLGNGPQRMYRTGDLGRLRNDGVLVYLGRADHQVKIRGFRIEPGEVEAALSAHVEGLAQIAVVPRQDGLAEFQEQYLAAYLVPRPGIVLPPVVDLRARLSAVLPQHMVPASFVVLDAFPLSPNGKLDRGALPAPQRDLAAGGLPRGAMEQAVHDIWCQVLALPAVGRDDDFFSVGGHSLRAVRLLASVRDRLGIDLPLSAVFAAPTIAGQAVLLSDAAQHAGALDVVAPPRQEPRDVHPLTPAQRRLWLLAAGQGAAKRDQTDLGGDPGPTGAYNLAVAFQLMGTLDASALAAALGDVAERHEALRTAFVEVDGAPVQRVLRSQAVPLPLIHVAQESDVLAAARCLAAQPFDLAAGRLLRTRLWQINEAEGDASTPRYVLLVIVHHLVGDAASLDVLMQDLMACYRHRLGEGPLPMPLLLQASDVGTRQAARYDAAARRADRAYWLDKLGGGLPMLDLPTDYPRPASRGWRGDLVSTVLVGARADALDALAAAEGVSLYVLLVAATQALLHRLTGQTDLVLGTAITARDDQALDDQVGFYVETVALRDTVMPAEPFRGLLGRVRQTVDQAVTHRRMPLDELVQALGLPRDPARNPVFDAMLVFDRPAIPLVEAGSLDIAPLPLAPPVSKLDLTVHYRRDAAGLQVALEYRTDLFEAARMYRMLGLIGTLLDDLATRGVDTEVGRLALLPAEEQAELAAFGAGDAAPLRAGRIEALFTEQARQNASCPAVVLPDGLLSYQELAGHAEAAASLLRGAGGLAAREPVLVMLDRGVPWLAALLGTLASGSVYMPADCRAPPARLSAMLARSNCRLAFAAEAPPGMEPCAELELGTGFGSLRLFAAPSTPDAAATTEPLPEDAACLIFTSGSTGEPKGVVVGHCGLLNTIERQIERLGIRSDDRVMLFASPAFDASLSEVFTAWGAGAIAVPADAETVADAPAFPDFMRRMGVTVATLPPAYLAVLGKADLPGVRVLLTAGEPPVASDLAHYARRLRYFNAYGPTEASICATMWEVPPGWQDGDGTPIGRPLANTAIHLMDAAMQLVPVGVPGEICLAGCGLALGYLGGGDGGAFVRHGGERLYRTGDAGQWRSDGQLLHLGRLDQQVKIRGQRVEPEEAARALLALPGVAQALVLPRRNEGDTYLAAWLVAADGAGPQSAAALRTALSAVLPRALIPSRFAWIGAMPLTVNGKVDQRGLPAPGPEAEEGLAPRTPAEQQVAAVFAAVLRRTTVPVEASFFDLGGDSLRLLQVAAELNKRGLRVDIASLYRAPTVAAVAATLDLTGEADQGPVSGPAPLMPAQAWFLRRYEGNRNHFNQSVLLQARIPLDEAWVQAGLDQLVAHHDALRAGIVGDERRIWQEFGMGPAHVVLRVHDFRDDLAPDAAMQRAADLVQRSLDIGAGRMLAVALFRLADGDALFLAAHHLAVDVVSWRILIEDLSGLLAALRDGRTPRLPRRTCSVQAWAEHQARATGSAALEAERPFWSTMLADAPDRVAGPISSRCQAVLAVPPTQAAAVLELGQVAQPVLLAAFARALSAGINEAAPVIVLEGHGREPVAEGLDVSRTVGWFTSLFPVRLELVGRSWEEAVAETVQVLHAVPNRGLGFGLLAGAAAEPGDGAGRLCLPAGCASFNFVGVIAAPAEDTVFLPSAANLGQAVDEGSRALFAMDLLASVRQGELVIELSHDPAVLSPAQARALLDAMRQDITTATASRHIDLAPSRPYVARGADEQPLILNPARPGIVAAMPPLFGYGAAFRNLGEALDIGTLCLFDFLEAEDRIARYVRAIERVVQRAASGRKLAVLGYSGGGNLGYALTQGLEEAGIAVSVLILLDAPTKRHRVVQSDEAVAEVMAGNLGYFEGRMAADTDYAAYVNQPGLRAMMLHRMKAFIRYLNDHTDTGIISADIALVRSAQQWAEPEDWTGWAERTRGRFTVHQGHGRHAHMTDGTNLNENAAIIRAILQAHGIDDGSNASRGAPVPEARCQALVLTRGS